MTAYSTKSGDTFDSIAYNLLGNAIYTKDLMQANPQYLSIVIFSNGIILNVPDITQSSTSTANLPPWRS
jgi:phage tail protein X